MLKRVEELFLFTIKIFKGKDTLFSLIFAIGFNNQLRFLLWSKK